MLREITGTYGEAKKVYVTALYALILALDRASPKAVLPLKTVEAAVAPR
jgi:hypothetical protein